MKTFMMLVVLIATLCSSVSAVTKGPATLPPAGSYKVINNNGNETGERIVFPTFTTFAQYVSTPVTWHRLDGTVREIGYCYEWTVDFINGFTTCRFRHPNPAIGAWSTIAVNGSDQWGAPSGAPWTPTGSSLLIP